jgi:putative spermidine/putrescine transport system substrate-binding protein
MTWHRLRRLGLVTSTLLVLEACSLTSTAGSTDWSKVTNAGQGGGMGALIAAARAEGKLTVIALPPDWANYGQIITTFESKYGIQITSLDPGGSGQDEVNAFDGTGRAPDVVDVGLDVALAGASKFAPYRVKEWDDIPAGAKEPSGAWYGGHGGYMGIGYDSSKVPAITSLEDLLGPAFNSKVALAGDPTRSNEGLNAVIMAAVARGGSLDDVTAGVNFFKALRQKGNYVPVVGTAATVNSGQTPVLVEWDYLSASHLADVPTWKIFVPSNAIIGGYYSQAINKQASHPAAARLWEEFLYSNEGQNLWLAGGVRPVRQAVMTGAGTIDAAAAAALPAVNGTPQVPSVNQTARAAGYIKATWSQAVG